ncbi:hypothetical protein AVEN_243189-1 [Araneus ventricosus]|uniref:Uncharacterized protein n=1 Tax=Araneus ventricosus TaxID=182803 RepID=A0A4Y2F0S0_ARAVE|nr:hypothetical protein AVEN_243189-1 [Araneus ventricosus]
MPYVICKGRAACYNFPSGGRSCRLVSGVARLAVGNYFHDEPSTNHVVFSLVWCSKAHSVPAYPTGFKALTGWRGRKLPSTKEERRPLSPGQREHKPSPEPGSHGPGHQRAHSPHQQAPCGTIKTSSITQKPGSHGFGHQRAHSPPSPMWNH